MFTDQSSSTEQNEKWNAYEHDWRLLYFKCCSVYLVEDELKKNRLQIKYFVNQKK
jgi:hypothetical protein